MVHRTAATRFSVLRLCRHPGAAGSRRLRAVTVEEPCTLDRLRLAWSDQVLVSPDSKPRKNTSLLLSSADHGRFCELVPGDPCCPHHTKLPDHHAANGRWWIGLGVDLELVPDGVPLGVEVLRLTLT